MSAGRHFLLGMRRSAALAVGAVPFGIATGVAATEAGLAPLEAVMMSVVVFAGAAQLALLELAPTGVPGAMLVLVAVVINLRFFLYGTSLASSFTGLSRRRRAGLAYLLTDQAFAVSAARFAEPEGQEHRASFYLGAATTLWVAWQVGTALGATVGMQAPDSLGLDFAAPLAFIALAVPALRDRTDRVVAVVSVVAYLGLRWLPASSGLVAAVVVGLVAGAWLDRRSA